MVAKLVVEKGDTVVISNPTSEATREFLYGTMVVKFRTKSGDIRVVDGYGRQFTYDDRGWPKGRAHGRLRALKEGETAETLGAIVADRQEADRAMCELAREGREQIRQERLAKVSAWAGEAGGEHWDYHVVRTLAGELVIVEVALPKGVLVLQLWYGAGEPGWLETERVSYPVTIYNRTVRGDGTVDGGSSSMRASSQDPKEVLVAYLHSWHSYEIGCE